MGCGQPSENGAEANERTAVGVARTGGRAAAGRAMGCRAAVGMAEVWKVVGVVGCVAATTRARAAALRWRRLCS